MGRQKYSNEFKMESVRLAERDGNAAKVARDLGLNAEILRRWIKEFGTRPDGSPSITPDEHDELIRLRRELRKVTEERDILKKAIGIFTKELP